MPVFPVSAEQLGKTAAKLRVSMLHLAKVVFSFPEVEITIQGHSTQFLIKKKKKDGAMQRAEGRAEIPEAGSQHG